MNDDQRQRLMTVVGIFGSLAVILVLVAIVRG